MLDRSIEVRECGRCCEEMSMFLRLDTVDGDIDIFELGNSRDTCNGLATETELLLADS